MTKIFNIKNLILLITFFFLILVVFSINYIFSFIPVYKQSGTKYIPTPSTPFIGQLDNENCLDENKYLNLVHITADINGYTSNAYYIADISSYPKSIIIPKNSDLYIKLMYWEDSDADQQEFHARALVCIKGMNKVSAVTLSTKNSQFKYPIRYNDPSTKISNILIQALYVIPNKGIKSSDWANKIKNNLINIQNAQNRIFNDKSNIDFVIYPIPLYESDVSIDFLSTVAKGIVEKKSNTENNSEKPLNFIQSTVYSDSQKNKYPEFYINTTKYNMVTTLVYFETDSTNPSIANESGYAFIYPALSNGNYLGLVGINTNKDFSKYAVPYHEFMHTLGLPDEYKYADGILQRQPNHIFNKQLINNPTLMEAPEILNLDNTYIDDQERIIMGIQL